MVSTISLIFIGPWRLEPAYRWKPHHLVFKNGAPMRPYMEPNRAQHLSITKSCVISGLHVGMAKLLAQTGLDEKLNNNSIFYFDDLPA